MQSEPNPSGSVVSLWHYPIKSMVGEELNSAIVTKPGLRDDRAYALIDVSSGKVVSTKNLSFSLCRYGGKNPID